jgi:hypothetical protein
MILTINSPQELYQIINEVKIQNPLITNFMGVMYLSINGCPCDADKHWENAISIYKKLKECDFSKIKSYKNLTSIRFNLNGEYLFEK